MKSSLKRKLATLALLTLIFTAYGNPLAIIAESIVASGFVDDLGVIKDNLVRIAKNGIKGAYASDADIKEEQTKDEEGNIINNIQVSVAGPSIDLSGVTNAINAVGSVVSTIDGKVDVTNENLGTIIENMGGIKNVLGSIDGNVSDIETLIKDGTNVKLDLINKTLEDNHDELMGDASGSRDDRTGIEGMNLSLIKLDSYLNQNQNTMNDILEVGGFMWKEGKGVETFKFIDGEQRLDTLKNHLVMIEQLIYNTQYNYRVAHMYSLNNMMNTSLWRPYTSDIPYIKDWVLTSGLFVNTYDGYWNANVSTLNNPANSRASRALEVLGYDAIVRSQGIALYNSTHNGWNYDATTGNFVYADGETKSGVIDGTASGNSGFSSLVYGEDGSILTSAILAHTIQEIPENNITWLDAVTVLYKALGQEQVTYTSYVVPNESITPNTSPTVVGLSGIAGLDGYDFYTFCNRDNIISGSTENPNYYYIYWEKALNDGFLRAPVGTSINELRDTPIMACDFYILASEMMQAYGEPEISLNEIKALLQVYGSDYPIQLGTEIADAWAYLKVRGCLDIEAGYTDTLSRDELLDVCMKIKDKDARSDYKVIEVVLNLSDLMKEDGYYPVKDLTISENSVTASITKDYASSDYYTYLIQKNNDTVLGSNNIQLMASPLKDNGSYEPIRTSIQTEDSSYNVEATYRGIVNYDSNQYYWFEIPKSWDKDIYICGVNISPDNKLSVIQGSGGVKYIKLEPNVQKGGIYNSGTLKDGVFAVSSEGRHSFTEFNGVAAFNYYTDAERAGDKREEQLASNSTILERLAFAYNKATTPRVAYAEEDIIIKEEHPSGSFGILNITLSDEHFKTGSTVKDFLGEGPDEPIMTTSNDTSVILRGANTPVSKILNTLVILEDSKNDVLESYIRSQVKTDISRKNIDTTLNYLYKMGFGFLPPVSQGDTATVMNSIISSDKPVITELYLGLNPESTRYVNTNHYSNSWNTVKGVVLFRRMSIYDSNYYTGVDSFERAYPNGIAYSELSDSLTEYMRSKGNLSIMDSVIKYSTEVESLVTYANSFFSADDGYWSMNDNTYKVGIANTSSCNNVRTKLAYLCLMSDRGSFTSVASTGTSNPDVENPGEDILSLDSNTTVYSSSIMNRDEQILLSWSDLVKNNVVLIDAINKKPTVTSTGDFHFYTKYGQVKVNNRYHTIQIGSTLYDLYNPDGTTPTLVYADQDQGGEIYFDYRCVMGVMNNRISRMDNSITEILPAIGAGNTAIYTIVDGDVESPLMNAKDGSITILPDSNGLVDERYSTSHSIPCIGSTMYDGSVINNGSEEFTYWPSSNPGGRITLTSFEPNANWMCLIDTKLGGTTGSLYVYYPIEPFKNGFVDNHQQVNSVTEITKDYVPVPEGYLSKWNNIESILREASAYNSAYDIKSQLENVYEVKVSDIVEGLMTNPEDYWYYAMTYCSIAELYKKTGSFNINKNWVVREFEITSNSVLNANSWVLKESGENTYVEEQLTGNDTGAIYWLDGIGFVYNVIEEKDFSLSKYFSGEIPLPIVQVNRGIPVYKLINLDSYGTAITVAQNEEGNKVVSEGTPIPYGYMLTKYGFIHYKCPGSFDVEEYTLISNDELPNANEMYVGSSVNPIPFNYERYVSAPSNIYFPFGGNERDSMVVSGISSYNTIQNKYYMGNMRLYMVGLQANSSDGVFKFISDSYNPIVISSDTKCYRVFRRWSGDTWLVNVGDKLNYQSVLDISKTRSDDQMTNDVKSWLESIGALELLKKIDDGASFVIVFAFKVMPIIGIILMTILVGLSFLCDNKVLAAIFEKTIDPVRILTLGARDLLHWRWKEVLFPCCLLYIVFALFLNGNIIRVIMFIAEWYGVITEWATHL